MQKILIKQGKPGKGFKDQESDLKQKGKPLNWYNFLGTDKLKSRISVPLEQKREDMKKRAKVKILIEIKDAGIN